MKMRRPKLGRLGHKDHMKGQHGRENGGNACHQPAGAVEKVDRVHHAHVPEDGHDPDQPPWEPFGAEEQAAAKWVVDMLNEDQPHDANHGGAKLDQVLGASTEGNAIVQEAKEYAIDRTGQKGDESGHLVGVIARRKPGCQRCGQPFRQDGDQQDGDKETAKEGKPAGPRDDADMFATPARPVYHSPAAADRAGQRRQGKGEEESKEGGEKEGHCRKHEL
jgi:hypothetical protein